MKCENCGNEHDGSYKTGRFCSEKCSKGFSTKEKRKEINDGLRKPPVNLVCVVCNGTFKYKNYRKKTCSEECKLKWNSINQTGIKHNIKDKSKMGGFRKGGGKAKQIPYINWLGFKMSLNKEEIEVAKILDEKKLNWNRNTKGFPYLTKEGKPRKFYPDFVINENKYIEYKGWVTEEMEWKMNEAVKTNRLNLSIIIGKDPRYQRFGITLNQFKNDNNN
jgi:predicted nucleic acid-binding Zn ribbon protein